MGPRTRGFTLPRFVCRVLLLQTTRRPVPFFSQTICRTSVIALSCPLPGSCPFSDCSLLYQVAQKFDATAAFEVPIRSPRGCWRATSVNKIHAIYYYIYVSCFQIRRISFITFSFFFFFLILNLIFVIKKWPQFPEFLNILNSIFFSN